MDCEVRKYQKLNVDKSMRSMTVIVLTAVRK